MKTSLPLRFLLSATACSFQCWCGAHGAEPVQESLQAGAPIALSGTHGKFDFLSIDSKGRRLLAAHTGNGTLDVIDLDSRKLIKSVETGHAQAAVTDATSEHYYVTSSVPPQLVTVDARTLKAIGTVSLSGPADLVAFDAKTGLVYAGHHDGQDLWVVNPAKKIVTATVELPGEAPEDLGFDAGHERLFQSMKTGSIIAVINVRTGKVTQTWPTAPAQNPHGMALVPDADAFLVAGGNGKLVLMSEKDGHVMAAADIPPRVDQIAYDAELHRIYCASGTGKIAIVSLAGETLQSQDEVASAEGAHSIAVDPQTHAVWIAYAKGDASFVQTFTPTK